MREKIKDVEEQSIKSLKNKQVPKREQGKYRREHDK